MALNQPPSDALILEIFRFQAHHNAVYKFYLQSLKIEVNDIIDPIQIPYLPIQFFKSQQVVSFDGLTENTQVFHSSGTTGFNTSKHYVFDSSFYQNLSQKIFEHHFGDLSNYHFLAILPSYQQNQNSSLIFMMDHFIKSSKSSISGYYLNDKAELEKAIKQIKKNPKKTIIWGVTYALLDLADADIEIDISDFIIFETGGMKGRRSEIPKDSLHQILKNKFKINQIGSEYGMTELLAQSYSQKNGIFDENFWFRVQLREINDPFKLVTTFGKNGVIQVMDLGNIGSCCFIETQDIGQKINENQFKILGRMDNSDVRGCNLLIN